MIFVWGNDGRSPPRERGSTKPCKTMRKLMIVSPA